MTTTYTCSSGRCQHDFETDVIAPEGNWAVHANPAWRRLCPECGCFGVPAVLMPPNRLVSDDLYFMFASCPNTQRCSLVDMYAADCERGQLMPKCLHALHEEQASIQYKLAQMGERLGLK